VRKIYNVSIGDNGQNIEMEEFVDNCFAPIFQIWQKDVVNPGEKVVLI